ncbi:hypothetical protein CaCOL14_008738 [Colletotrichum acutatum]
MVFTIELSQTRIADRRATGKLFQAAQECDFCSAKLGRSTGSAERTPDPAGPDGCASAPEKWTPVVGLDTPRSDQDLAQHSFRLSLLGCISTCQSKSSGPARMGIASHFHPMWLSGTLTAH